MSFVKHGLGERGRVGCVGRRGFVGWGGQTTSLNEWIWYISYCSLCM